MTPTPTPTPTPPNRSTPARSGGLNFWQWVGMVVLAIGVTLYSYQCYARDDGVQPAPRDVDQSAPTQAVTPTTTNPTTLPAGGGASVE